MSDPVSDTGGLDDETLAFAARVFDLARDGDTEELGRLVDAGLPVNLTTGTGDTLLILAAYHRHPDTVASLVARGADVNKVNDRGQSALGAAVFRQDAASVRVLVAAGADPDAGRQSARATAAVFDLPEMAALLPPMGASGG